jgi:hypothetical protein
MDMKCHCGYLTLLAIMLSSCQILQTKQPTSNLPTSSNPNLQTTRNFIPGPPTPTISHIFTQIQDDLDTPFKPTKTTTFTPPPPTPTPGPTTPPAGTFAIKFYPPLVLDYPTDQWIDKSEYDNTQMMINFLQNSELMTCTINPMGPSGFYPDNMQEINLGGIRYQILLNQHLTNGTVANYYFAFITYKGIGEHLPGLPHFAVQSSPTEAEKCRTAAEEVLATLQSPDQSNWNSTTTPIPPCPLITTTSTPSSNPYVGAMAISRHFAYVAINSSIKVFDISNPKILCAIGQSEPVSGFFVGLSLEGDRLYGCGNGIYIFDVSDPMKPRLIGSLKVSEFFLKRIIIKDDIAIAIDPNFGLIIFDVSEPSAPRLLSKTNIQGEPAGVTFAGGYVYLAAMDEVTYKNGGLLVFDISNPQSPSLATSLDLFDVLDVAVSWPYAYLIARDVSGTYNFYILNVSSPGHPSLYSIIPLAIKYDYLVIASGYAFLNGFSCDEVTGNCRTFGDVLDIHNPLAPTNWNGYIEPGNLQSINATGYIVIWNGLEYQVNGQRLEVWQFPQPGREPGRIKISDINLLNP